MEVALPALIISMLIVAGLLARQRSRTKPEQESETPPPKSRRSSRTARVLEKLEPLPEIPTLMDLVRIEIAEEGIDEIPGRDGLPDPVVLKVFRRDEAVRTGCSHNAFEYRLAADVAPDNATEAEVQLVCPICESEGPGT